MGPGGGAGRGGAGGGSLRGLGRGGGGSDGGRNTDLPATPLPTRRDRISRSGKSLTLIIIIIIRSRFWLEQLKHLAFLLACVVHFCHHVLLKNNKLGHWPLDPALCSPHPPRAKHRVRDRPASGAVLLPHPLKERVPRRRCLRSDHMVRLISDRHNSHRHI